MFGCRYNTQVTKRFLDFAEGQTFRKDGAQSFRSKFVSGADRVAGLLGADRIDSASLIPLPDFGSGFFFKEAFS